MILLKVIIKKLQARHLPIKAIINLLPREKIKEAKMIGY